jgi:hypothetical protein
MFATIFAIGTLPALAERYQIDRYYRGPLCLNLGQFSGQRAVRVEWGAWVAQKTINGDLNNEQLISFRAQGNNVPNIDIYGINNAQLRRSECDPRFPENGLSWIHTLDWSRR